MIVVVGDDLSGNFDAALARINERSGPCSQARPHFGDLVLEEPKALIILQPIAHLFPAHGI